MWNEEFRMVNEGGGRRGAVVAFLLSFCVLHLALCISTSGAQSIPDEFRISRQDVFEFAQKPTVEATGDRVAIRFASLAACDATVAIEDARGTIVRHLAAGCLGPNAPTPFQKDALRQNLHWDGKDDQGRYIDDRAGLSVRVSLGLRARYERPLFWEPKRRYSREIPLICPAPDGVYVYDGDNAMDFLRLYDHDGNYVRTIYPFPADKLESVNGLMWHTFAQDGRKLPIKGNFLQNTMLTSGTNAFRAMTFKPDLDRYDSAVGGANEHYGMYGRGAMAMAVRGGRIALANVFLNRLATDGGSGGMTLTGPQVAKLVVSKGAFDRGDSTPVPPRSIALSPDGRTLYLTGYVYSHRGKASADIVTYRDWNCFQGVYKMSMQGDEPPTLFAGSDRQGDGGSADGQFRVPVWVEVDSAGRVYVADYMNDRVQIFSPDGKFLSKFAVSKPARIALDEKAGQIYVFSCLVQNHLIQADRDHQVPAVLTRFAPLDAPRKVASCPVPTEGYRGSMGGYYAGLLMTAAPDPWSAGAAPTVWTAEAYQAENVLTRRRDRELNIRLLALSDGKLTLTRDFGEEAHKSVVRASPPRNARQRLYVNPKTGKLYVGEGDAFVYKSFKQLVEIDPNTGRIRLVELPFDAEDMCFDHNGFAYLRTISVVARYDPATWREVPWDYGEERDKVYTSASSDRRESAVLSGLALPANGGWHHGGMFVSLKGRLVVVCLNENAPASRLEEPTAHVTGGKPFAPTMYPGRVISGRGGGVYLHVWDDHGKLLRQDLVPGLADNTYGVGLDNDDNVYLLAAATRVLDGQRYFNDMTGTLLKFSAAGGKVLSQSDRAPVPLSVDSYPKRAVDLQNAGQGPAWVDGVAWMYGGVGWCGKNRGIGCACWNTRFAMDYFNRSFAPEMDRYSVAVLDGAGNVLLRIGQYGNEDDGLPLVPTPNAPSPASGASRAPSAAGGPALPRSVGADEVAFMHGAYVATDTDKRLFIADPGNGRIVAVKLDYHATERVSLK